MSLKIGDRVVNIILSQSQLKPVCQRGVVVEKDMRVHMTDKIIPVRLDKYNYGKKDDYHGINENILVLESIYDSPLAKAMREEE